MRLVPPVAIIGSLLCLPLVPGETLDDLLKDKKQPGDLVESATFKKSWASTLDALAKRDYAAADPLLARMDKEIGYIEPRHRDFVRIAAKLVHYKSSLEVDKAAFRDDFNKIGESIADTKAAISRMEHDAQNLAAQYGNNIPPATRKNMEERYVALKAAVPRLQDKQADMQKQALEFENSRKAAQDADVCVWLHKDREEEDAKLGIILSTVFLDQVGDSQTVSTLSQDLVSKQKMLETASKIVAVIRDEVQSLVDNGKADAARDMLAARIKQVEESSQDPFVKQVATARLSAISTTAASASQAAQAESSELSARLDVLESRLSTAQDVMGTVVHSIEGWSKFDSKGSVSTDRSALAQKLRSEISSGSITTDKKENLVKAKSQQLGILREVQSLQSAIRAPSAIQKGRLLNLETSAKQALEMLDGV